jgi:exopolysaccharide biosynthesis polyprenyl glycosylphosphotransferase
MGTTNLSPDVVSAPAWQRREHGRGFSFTGVGPLHIVQMAFDLAALVAAWHLAFQVRLLINPLLSLEFSREQLSQAAPSLGGLLALWSATNLWLILSGSKRHESGSLNMFRLSESTLLVSVIAVPAIFFSQEMGAGVSRSFMLLFAPISYCMLIVARSAQHWVWLRIAETWPAVVERVAIIGAGEGAMEAADRIRKTEFGATQMIGVIVPKGAPQEIPTDLVPTLGETSILAELINRNQLNRLVILNGSLDGSEFEQCTRIANRMGVALSHELHSSLAGLNVSLQTLFGVPMLEWRPVSFTRAEEVLKRGLDLLVAFATLLLALPAMIVVAILVKATSPGPIFYNAPRVGRGGRHFNFYKFRTMYYDPEGRIKVAAANEHDGHIFKIKRDPRITPVGRIMRRFSIDELPQLINILLGHMSLIGPRPLPAGDLDPDGMSRQHPTWAELRSLVKPGLTGLWQVRGRSDLPFEEMIQLDLEYIQNWSLALDLKILLATPLVVITGRGAY